MFAIVNISGFQEMVKKGDVLRVPSQEGDKDKVLTFGEVLLVVDGDKITFGMPFLKGASVEGKLMKHGRGEKIRIVKAHKRKRYRRVKGHRQGYTDIEITGIKL